MALACEKVHCKKKSDRKYEREKKEVTYDSKVWGTNLPFVTMYTHSRVAKRLRPSISVLKITNERQTV